MSTMDLSHSAVLLEEAIAGLHIKQSGIYVDLTFGRGGHSAAILKKLGPEGRLIALDRDTTAIKEANTRPLFQDSRFSIHHTAFSHLEELMQSCDCAGKVDGVLMDLGVSSPQLDDAARGFSFMRDGALDMRMDTSAGLTAAQWLNSAELEEMSQVFKELGEERFHWRIAKEIVASRAEAPIATTLELAALIERVCPVREKHKHPATRVFQAIRININAELEELRQVLKQALEVLAVTGRLCVISFHSLEDRIVKQFIRKHATEDPYPADLPIQANLIQFRLKKIGGLVRPTAAEMQKNRRARSGRLRIAEKLR